ncbi:hypothetical protein LJR231_002843 [Phyllobacterium sp. LjRoot231]|uniref:hypothetical protein n=1 Tax=Phyllobacterium sp. LjRoot231 TaxID=3342289 RepID=UPI003ECF26A2
MTQFPLYWVQHPDITDFPNHLARIHTLMRLSQSETLQRYYELRDLQIGTNLAMEVIVPALASWMSLALALKVFASLSTLLLTTGAVMVGRTITGCFSYLLLGVLLFANSAIFRLGLLNYLFGVGAAFWLLSAWIVAGRQAGARRLIPFSAGSVVLYLCHLSALGIYVIGVVGYELSLARSRGRLLTLSAWRPLLLALMQFVPAAMLHVLVSSNSAGSYVPAPSPFAGLGMSIVYKYLSTLHQGSAFRAIRLARSRSAYPWSSYSISVFESVHCGWPLPHDGWPDCLRLQSPCFRPPGSAQISSTSD